MLQTRTSLLCATALASFVTALPAAAAPSQAMIFNIEAGRLEGALLAYAAQTQRQILFDRGLVASIRSPAVKGALTADEALGRLLAGTGLVARRTGPNVFVVKAEIRDGDNRQPPVMKLAGLGAAVPEPPLISTAPAEVPAAQILDEVIVTGSLIRGANVPTSPLLALDRDAVDRGGHGSVADLLAALPQNFGGSGSADSSLVGSDGRATNDQAATGVNLRGLGASATLVLVNGRRMGGTGTKGDFADASALPTAAVERVHVLLDGASALYVSSVIECFLAITAGRAVRTASQCRTPEARP